MPRSCETDQTFPAVLKSDQGKPDPKPTFHFRYLSGREFINLLTLFDEMQDATKGGDRIQKCFDLLRFPLASWENIVDRKGNAIAYDAAKLEDVVSYHEAEELLKLCMVGNNTQAEEPAAANA